MDLKNLPDVQFIELDAEKLLNDALTIAEKSLGRTLHRADPLTLFIKALIAICLQQQALINDLARQNLLAYARGDKLDHFGALVGVTRNLATSATCTAKVTLSAPLDKAVTIVQGTRINAGDDVNFAMDDDLIFLAGETELTAKFTCVETGKVGNSYRVGQLNKIVDPQPFLLAIENVTVSDGGADIEEDDNFRARIAEAPESFSVAGPFGAYKFFTKSASNLITDVFILSEKPGEVDVYFLQENGDLPTAEVIELVSETLNDRKIRPLSDHLFIKSPDVVEYDIDLTYYISRDDSSIAATIQRKVDAAVADFITWQKSKIGRDVNKTELEHRIRVAGAKRVEIIAPTFTKVRAGLFDADGNEYFSGTVPADDSELFTHVEVAHCANVNVVYAGLEEE